MKIEGDAASCDQRRYFVWSQAFYGHPGQRMQPADFGFSDPTQSKTGCSLSLALIQTEDGPSKRLFREAIMGWQPLDSSSGHLCAGPSEQRIPISTISSSATTINPETLAFSEPITIKPSLEGSGCSLTLWKPYDAATDDPVTFPNPLPPDSLDPRRPRYSRHWVAASGDAAECEIAQNQNIALPPDGVFRLFAGHPNPRFPTDRPLTITVKRSNSTARCKLQFMGSDLGFSLVN